jgi:hypothetical protein
MRNAHLDVKLKNKKLEQKSKQDQAKVSSLESDKKALKQVPPPMMGFFAF